MSWVDELIPARISNSRSSVAFKLSSAGKTGGRRTEAHEFADVDGAWIEDSGGVPHRYQLQVFVVGDSYNVELQRLEEILDGPGPLELDHPFRGTIENLWLDGEYSTEETVERLGFATLSFTLVQSGVPEPLIFESLSSLAGVRAGAVFAAAQAQFEAEYSGRDILGSALRALGRISKALTRAYNKILAVFGPIDDVRNAVAAFNSALQTITSLPGLLVAKFRLVVRLLNSLTAKKSKGQGRPASGFGSPLPNLTSIATELAEANTTPEATADSDAVTAGGVAGTAKKDLDALQVLVKATALAALTETLTQLELPTAAEAQALSDYISEYADELLEAQINGEPISSALYDSVIQLKVDVAALLAQLKKELPTVVTFEAAATMPLTILAYSQQGATGSNLSALVKALLENNDVDDPLVIPDGTVLQAVMP